ncbi:reverse transcriptase domain-containing protein [Tanacetum coccineum]
MHSYAIRLKFNVSNDAMDYEVLLAGLAASVSKGMKDLHVFIDSLTLVAQIEGNHTPIMEQEKKSVNKVGNHKVGIFNQEVSVDIKTRPSVEETRSSKKEKAASNVPGTKPSYNWETIGSK